MSEISDLNDEYGIKLKAATEYALQVHVFRYLRGTIKNGRNVIHVTVPFPEVEAWHVFQGRRYNNSDTEEERLAADRQGFFLKELGVTAGVHDIHMIWPNAFSTIELKVGKGSQSPYQRTFTMHMERCGHKVAVCRSVAQVRDAIIGWGLECKNVRCIEPPRSELERREAAFDMYRR